MMIIIIIAPRESAHGIASTSVCWPGSGLKRATSRQIATIRIQLALQQSTYVCRPVPVGSGCEVPAGSNWPPDSLQLASAGALL